MAPSVIFETLLSHSGTSPMATPGPLFNRLIA